MVACPHSGAHVPSHCKQAKLQVELLANVLGPIQAPAQLALVSVTPLQLWDDGHHLQVKRLSVLLRHS
jgi:hypothetical protein